MMIDRPSTSMVIHLIRAYRPEASSVQEERVIEAVAALPDEVEALTVADIIYRECNR